MSKKIFKVLSIVVVLAIACSLVLSGCGGSAKTADNSKSTDSGKAAASDAPKAENKGPAAKIRFAHMWQEGKNDEATTALDILKKLDSEHPEFEIAHEVVVGDEMRNKIRVDVAANNAPDMWQFWAGGVLADYVKNGILLDIDQYLAKSQRLKKEDIPDSAWNTCTFDGKIRAVPRNVSVGVLLCNKELFQKYNLQYPKTWEEFIAVGKEFRKNGIAPTNIGSKGGNPSHFWYGDLVCQYNAGVTESENIGKTLNFKNDPFIKAAKYCEEMRKAGMFPDDVVANGDWAPSIAYYNQGKSAMGYTFGWCFADMSPEMVEKSEIIPIPKLPDGERDTATFIQGTVNDAYTINSKSFADEKKQMALVAIMDAVCKDINLALGQKGLLVPVDTTVMKQIDLAKMSDKMMAKTLQYRIEHNVNGSPMIWQNLPDNKLQFDYQATLDELWAGAVTADEYIEKVQKSCDEYKSKTK